MKKPFNIDKRLKNGEAKRRFNIRFNDDTSHEEVLYQFVTGLVQGGFAPEEEILSEISSLLQLEVIREKLKMEDT